MLKVPRINRLDHRFTLAILNRIDLRRRAIRVNENKFIDITDEEVQRFLDIPIGPKKLLVLKTHPLQKKVIS